MKYILPFECFFKCLHGNWRSSVIGSGCCMTIWKCRLNCTSFLLSISHYWFERTALSHTHSVVTVYLTFWSIDCSKSSRRTKHSWSNRHAQRCHWRHHTSHHWSSHYSWRRKTRRSCHHHWRHHTHHRRRSSHHMSYWRTKQSVSHSWHHWPRHHWIEWHVGRHHRRLNHVEAIGSKKISIKFAVLSMIIISRRGRNGRRQLTCRWKKKQYCDCDHDCKDNQDTNYTARRWSRRHWIQGRWSRVRFILYLKVMLSLFHTRFQFELSKESRKRLLLTHDSLTSFRVTDLPLNLWVTRNTLVVMKPCEFIGQEAL